MTSPTPPPRHQNPSIAVGGMPPQWTFICCVFLIFVFVLGIVSIARQRRPDDDVYPLYRCHASFYETQSGPNANWRPAQPLTRC